MMQCLADYSEKYRDTYKTIDAEFVGSFREQIVPVIQAGDGWEDYLDRLKRWRKLSEYKFDSALLMDSLAQEYYLAHIPEDIRRAFEQGAQSRIKDTRTYYIGLACGVVGQLFYSIECSCKVACALGDLSFAERTASGDILTHNDVFYALRRISKESFGVGFPELANLYAYTIKTRMLADYDEYFYNEDAVWNVISLDLLPMAKFICARQRDLLYECAQV